MMGLSESSTQPSRSKVSFAMTETASFVDPVFLARFGLSRANVLEYFLHPLNPFRSTSGKTITNEHLASQQTTIGMLMAQGLRGEGPMPAIAAEEEYNKLLSKYTNEEQYELLPPLPTTDDPSATQQQQQQPTPSADEQLSLLYTTPSPLYVIRHVFRSSTTSVKVLGVYYCVEGVLYQSPAARSLLKTHVARCATAALGAACHILAPCARFAPATGYCWVFEAQPSAADSDDEEYDPLRLLELTQKQKRRKIVDNRRPEERTPEEEEGRRASEAMDQILVRLTQSEWVQPQSDSKSAATTKQSET